jgi:hypothetical protein
VKDKANSMLKQERGTCFFIKGLFRGSIYS